VCECELDLALDARLRGAHEPSAEHRDGARVLRERGGTHVKAGWVARFRERLFTNFHTNADRAEALKAVGLSE
jgi:hypothetical protein